MVAAAVEPAGMGRVDAAQVTAWTLTAAAVAVAVATVAVISAWPVQVSGVPLGVLIGVLYPAVGVLIVGRHPRNAVGWILIAIGVLEALDSLTVLLAQVAMEVDPGRIPAGQVITWLSDWLWIPAHALLVTFLPLLFPDGRLPSRRWWPIAALAGMALALHVAAPMTLLGQLALRGEDGRYPDEAMAERLGGVGYYLVLVVAVLCLVALAWRLVHMSGEERRRAVWFAGAAAIAVLLILPMNLISDPRVEEFMRTSAALVLPIGAAVSILRHRLYGIDVVVNRALVYLTLSGVLVGVYLGAAAAVDALFSGPRLTAPLVAAGATALVLSPVRARVQRSVNRLMYGHRDEAETVVAAIGGRLEALAMGPDVLDDVTAHIAQSLRLPCLAVEVGVGEEAHIAAAHGKLTEPVERLPLVAHREVVGHLIAAPRRGTGGLSGRDRRALQEICRFAASAVRQVQLTDELRRSRERLASALEEERRRIRRDLHDGLGPSLATVVMGLEEVRAVHRNEPQRADSLLHDLKQQTREAVEDVRALVYGLRPPALDELGLLGAVRELVTSTAARTGLDVRLDAPDRLPELSAAVEATAYRICQETLTNVVRHAGARACQVVIHHADGVLRIRVNDDGCGLPDGFRAGVGLQSMRERAGDVGGDVTLRADGGTVVDVCLPLSAS